jgi:ribosomal protein S18 acetylase RimI-like enzyme
VLETELYFFCSPRGGQAVEVAVDFCTVQEFVADEPACKLLWDLVGSQFRTRSKFLTIWQNVRYVAVCRSSDGAIDGLLLVSSPVNWQIDYVVVRPETRGRGIATALINAAVNEASARGVPYVMLTSRESLRALYESCGFTVVNAAQLVA